MMGILKKSIACGVCAVALFANTIGAAKADDDEPLSRAELVQGVAVLKSWGASRGQILKIEGFSPWLLGAEALNSADGFNPYAVKFESVEEFDADTDLTDEQAWKWLRYRRAELGVCFEDEEFDSVAGVCVVVDGLYGVEE